MAHPDPEAVVCHVYDLLPALNDKVFRAGVGIFHSGIEVLGREFWFFGHEFPFSGIVVLPPGLQRMGAMGKRESVVVGKIAPRFRRGGESGGASIVGSSAEFEALLDELTLTYAGNGYHPIHRNCNHFADEFARRLVDPDQQTGEGNSSVLDRVRSCVPCLPLALQEPGIPRYVNRAAYVGSWVLAAVSEETLWKLFMRYLGGGSGVVEGHDERAQNTDTEVETARPDGGEESVAISIDTPDVTRRPQHGSSASTGEPDASGEGSSGHTHTHGHGGEEHTSEATAAGPASALFDVANIPPERQRHMVTNMFIRLNGPMMEFDRGV
jgi:PPPDE putative peptidase domain